MKRAVAVGIVTLVFTSAAGNSAAAWVASGGGDGSAASDSFPATAPAAPSVSVSGTTVDINFAAVSTAARGIAATSYIMSRYATASGGVALSTFNCTRAATAPNCTDTQLAGSTTYYSYTPRLGANWVGVESARSSAAIVPSGDTTAPTVISLGSTDGDGIAEVGDVITIGFSEAVKVSSPTATLSMTRANNASAVITLPTVVNGSITLPNGAFFSQSSGSKSASFGVTVVATGSSVVVTLTSATAGNDSVGAGGAGTVAFQPSTSITDLADNQATGTFNTPAAFRIF